MMKTCRLLCALLVLALCCRPSVCVAESEDTAGKSGKGSVPTISMPVYPKQVSDPSSKTPSPPKINDEVGGTEQSRTTGTVIETPQSQNTSNNAQDQDGGKPTTEDADIDKANMSNEQNKKKYASTATTTTTTTTTRAPTTTTTTTTTAAPQALSTTTTTEAPTTTTTRVPSLLREIDGSLSSSAWVCAPLLLAVSALAYTALG
ncbi:mucin TcMUCII [Trypanosoma cruzi]|uniref:Mucin TcMUCII, putative n=1 Tax=Trypanosoma cruzi (strain CL Brener) TaxID=353153 RepID=Q4E4Y4_TRYCC|nr:mucin TcMUCII, putative [Trypanosoma cruzi]EAN99828.1 mucin TcMUCII, putative [Trypanosoma cruzi]RNC38230.1 mucin TcMUCII [Trypanosoma cruzi]|eukprot:XP_821679.1 mucin TcMUCII [Trypanosoma cruzi strain CL Brener]